MRTPNCIYIGYQKTGSTFLRGYFDQHPEICWTRQGGYFLQDDAQGLSLEEYQKRLEHPTVGPACFIDTLESLAVGPISGPSTDWHSSRLDPQASLAQGTIEINPEKVANNIHRLLGDTRILITVRNQTDWLRSTYLHFRRSLPKGKNGFLDFITTPLGKATLHSGRFEVVVGHYQKLFGVDRVFVLPLERVIRERQTALGQLCSFLDITPHLYTPPKASRNKGSGGIPSSLFKIASSLGPVSRLISSTGIARHPRMQELLSKDPISPCYKQILTSFYAVGNSKLATMLDLDLNQYGYSM